MRHRRRRARRRCNSHERVLRSATFGRLETRAADSQDAFPLQRRSAALAPTIDGCAELHGALAPPTVRRNEGPPRGALLHPLRETVYVLKPTGPVEDDPNLTNARFKGNPTKSLRSRAPLRTAF